LQAESTHDLAQSKVELLRLSLDQRLAEIPTTSSFSRMQILREELDCMNTTGQMRDSVVAKMAALSGKLNLRFGVVELIAEFASCFATKQAPDVQIILWSSTTRFILGLL